MCHRDDALRCGTFTTRLPARLFLIYASYHQHRVPVTGTLQPVFRKPLSFSSFTSDPCAARPS
jgi:hypothetical protein